MTVTGMLRVKNEGRWITEVLEALEPLCGRILLLDDHSSDDTVEQAEAAGVDVYRSPFRDFDESRDKNWLLARVLRQLPEAEINADSTHWAAVIDGDEILEPGSAERIKAELATARANSYALRVLYLWDRRDKVRVDGVYRDFWRPSIFRLINPAFRFQSTPWAGNMHCSSVPQELIHGFARAPGRLLHLGYLDRADRLRKWRWYNETDPDNPAEDCYRHMVIGDLPELPASTRSVHGGPLKLVPLSAVTESG